MSEMQQATKLYLVTPKPIKKYSIDLGLFSSQSFGSSCCSIDSPVKSKNRKMTYDFQIIPNRSKNPMQKDECFQRMNNQESTLSIDIQDFII